MKLPKNHTLPVLILAATIGIAMIGCKSADRPASTGFASVQIRDHTPEQIRAATVVVFQQDGYASPSQKRGEMIFEKEGSRWDQIAYGNWVDSGGVWIRVKASVVPAANGTFRLQCQAYRIVNKGEPAFEEEVRLATTHRKPFQALLDRVARQLGS